MPERLKALSLRIQTTMNGNPWYGKSIWDLLEAVPEEKVYRKEGESHSILELLWHMITWREFVVDRLQHSQKMDLEYFEKNDWRSLDHSDKTLWPQGKERLLETQNQILSLLEQRDDSLLDEKVREKDYNFQHLLEGIIEHDIYHIGQIAAAGRSDGEIRRCENVEM